MRRLIAALLLAVVTGPALADEPPPPASPVSDAELRARAEATFRAGTESVRKPAEARAGFSGRRPTISSNCIAAAPARRCTSTWATRACSPTACPARSGRMTTVALDPKHHDLREHLAFARGRVNYAADGRGMPAPDPWPAWLHRPSPPALLLAAGIAYSRGLGLRRVVVSAARTVAALDCPRAAGRRHRRRRLGVVGSAAARSATSPSHSSSWGGEGTALQRGNGTSYPRHPDVPTLPAGLEARVLHRRGDWLQVRLATGEVGWVPSDAVLVVEP